PMRNKPVVSKIGFLIFSPFQIRDTKGHRSSPVVIRLSPRFVWVVQLHVFKDAERIRAQIFLINIPLVADYKGLNTCYAVFSRRGGKCKSADHRTVHNKVHFPKRCRRTLSFQDFEEISVIRLTSIRIPLRQSLGDSFSNWASPTPIGILPSKTILFSRGTDDSLRVLVHLCSVM